MSTLQIPAHLETAFEQGTTWQSTGKSCTFYTVEAGNLKNTTGQIIACDPYIPGQENAFTTQFPKGEFPVQLAIAKFENDERIAFARIKFADTLPTTWKMALCEGEDISTLQSDEVFCYGVDAGTGAFMDTAAAAELDAFLAEDDAHYDYLTTEMDKTYTHTRSWMMWTGKSTNAALFSSGWGDGCYGSFIGYDENGNICRLVTDFSVV
ncbi:MAG: DUF4241 domain-containing protein [Chitinophaga sp.]|uniref:DUF4241 domain-containing protein n=1 Tax=Chitinophaga sp. TaxID=1869181 RepID=UPI0025BF8EE9|nr:DUF4241 domain-containing protein [Chitinophaga sp.]MBV8252379.1 DUF4241 domain-containing protein [Chitinophaga sp.]